MTPFWMAVLLDYTADEYDTAAAHWQRLTGWPLNEPLGDHGEFQGFLPPEGHVHLAVQRLGDGPNRVHLDLHVTDPPAAARAAIGAGATMIIDNPECTVVGSPGGFVLCFLGDQGSEIPPATRWPDGTTSRADQLCVDIPQAQWESEVAFWETITGWRAEPVGPEFSRLQVPADQPIRILLQRLDEPDGVVRGHVDWAASDRDAESRRHVALGSRVVEVAEHWTVMDGPGGIYCITTRTP